MARKRFYTEMLELEQIVLQHKHSGPIIVGLYYRLCAVFNRTPIQDALYDFSAE